MIRSHVIPKNFVTTVLLYPHEFHKTGDAKKLIQAPSGHRFYYIKHSNCLNDLIYETYNSLVVQPIPISKTGVK
jgi:hypothetical protein